ncbi:MAG: LptF/LptG family permease, partial [Gammaproteobacteria bacterium]|nr:LptF/LptG family permease [Gammaproteobacteria bacterium]
MRTLDRYIGNTVIGATLMVFIVFFGLRLFVGIFGELGAIGTGDYHILQAVQYVLLTMPLNIYQLYPNIALLGALAALGILASNNELTVMRASGISIAQIAWSVLKAAIWLLILVTVLGEAFSPTLDAYAERQKSLKETQGTLSETQSQLWLHEGNGFINIGSSEKDGTLHNITQFTFTSDHQLASASYAQSANFVNGDWIV